MDLEKYQKRFKGIKILLVEDDQLNQQVETELLESVDFSVDTAGNGMEALDLFKGENQYNLILMDMQMPKMDGLTATRQIRRLTKGKGIPIIAMTGNAFPEDRLQCLNAGMNDVVLKPIDTDNLFQILAQWIDASQISPESKTENAKDEEASLKNLLLTCKGIDFDQVSNVFDSDYKHFIEMIEKFDRLNAEKIDVCIEKIQSGDFATALDFIHRMSGTAGTLGLRSIHKKSKSIELLLLEKERNIDDLLSLCDQLKDDYSDLNAFLLRVKMSMKGLSEDQD